jgi:hypothetical protein
MRCILGPMISGPMAAGRTSWNPILLNVISDSTTSDLGPDANTVVWDEALPMKTRHTNHIPSFCQIGYQ